MKCLSLLPYVDILSSCSILCVGARARVCFGYGGLVGRDYFHKKTCNSSTLDYHWLNLDLYPLARGEIPLKKRAHHRSFLVNPFLFLLASAEMVEWINESHTESLQQKVIQAHPCLFPKSTLS